MYKFFAAFSLLVIIILIIFVGSGSRNTQEPNQDSYHEKYKNHYGIYSPPIPKKVDFAGEELPLNIFYVYEALEREVLVNVYWQSNTILALKRAYRWFPVIEPILKENGVPDDFKYLAVIESGLLNVTSPAGAQGYWQFMKTTAKSYNLEIDLDVDQRLHVQKATEAACRYLKDSYRTFGNWTLAAASYNMGSGGVAKNLDRQNTQTFYELNLNSETSRYIYRIVAMKLIFSSPQSYGLNLRPSDLYPPLMYNVVVVDTPITSLYNFAKNMEVSYKMLKELNPWLINSKLTNHERKRYEIYLPKAEMTDYQNLTAKQGNEIGVFGDK